jgi:hypothetical protein
VTLLYVALGLLGLALVGTIVAAFVLAMMANRRAVRNDELLAALHVRMTQETSALGGRCSEIRALAHAAAAKAQDAFQATAQMRRGRRLTDPVVPFPPPLSSNDPELV